MSKIDYQALRAKAEKATCGEWSLEYGEGRFDGDDALIHREAAGYIPICRIEGAHPESGFDEDFQMEQQANAEFIAEANPDTVLALLDEIKRLEDTNIDAMCRIAELETNLAALAAENAGLKSDVPLGAIENGRAFADRLENYYQFECDGGKLNMCSDWQEFRRCFEYLSEWVMHSQTDKYADPRCVIPLYRVPDKLPREYIRGWPLGHSDYAQGWNDCREAMLQGKGE